MPPDNSPPVKQGDISHAVERSQQSVSIDLARFHEKTDIIIKQNARQWWVMIVFLIAATAFVVTRESEWRWFKANVIRRAEFAQWAYRTEKASRANGVAWEAAEMPMFTEGNR
jgi:hypothetical protein